MLRASTSRGVLAMLLAGGQGERLYPLTKNVAKPAVSFGGIYRIIDFTLSNCLNSGIQRIYVLTQHKSLQLDRHLRWGWNLWQPELGGFIETVPPQQLIVSRWYAGTADAVFQNIYLLEEARPERVLILAGDHVYKMDYSLLLGFHEKCSAEVTVGCLEMEREQACRFGVMEVNEEGRIIGFEEKPRRPKPLPHDDARSLVSMGIYAFNTDVLVRAVIQDAKRDTDHDFGKNIIPELVHTHRVYAFNIRQNCPRKFHYWRDIGAIDSYYDSHMELLKDNPPIDLFDPEWPIRSYTGQSPPALVCDRGRLRARVRNSLLSPGCLIEGATVTHSVLSPHVHVQPGATVSDSILMPNVVVGENAVVQQAIVDEMVSIPPKTSIGVNLEEDKRRFVVIPSNVVVVPSRTIFQR